MSGMIDRGCQDLSAGGHAAGPRANVASGDIRAVVRRVAVQGKRAARDGWLESGGSTMTDNYDDVTQYRLDPEREQELLETQHECTFIWSTKDGHPLGVIMCYVWKDGRIWLTAARHRQRVPAIRRDARSSVVISSVGTPMGGGKTVTYKGRTKIHDNDPALKAWFYPALAYAMVAPAEAKRAGDFNRGLVPEQFVKSLDTPERVILEFTPEMKILFDGDKMAKATATGSGAG